MFETAALFGFQGFLLSAERVTGFQREGNHLWKIKYILSEGLGYGQ